MGLEAALVAAVLKLLADVGASAINEKIRRNKEAGEVTPDSLVWTAIILNAASLNADKVAQLLRDRGQPDGRKAR